MTLSDISRYLSVSSSSQAPLFRHRSKRRQAARRPRSASGTEDHSCCSKRQRQQRHLVISAIGLFSIWSVTWGYVIPGDPKIGPSCIYVESKLLKCPRGLQFRLPNKMRSSDFDVSASQFFTRCQPPSMATAGADCKKMQED